MIKKDEEKTREGCEDNRLPRQSLETMLNQPTEKERKRKKEAVSYGWAILD